MSKISELFSKGAYSVMILVSFPQAWEVETQVYLQMFTPNSLIELKCIEEKELHSPNKDLLRAFYVPSTF